MFRQNLPDISFRPLQLQDVSLLYRWLHEPHVHTWYDKDKQNTLEEITQKYSKKIVGKEPTQGFIILWNTFPIGYIQASLVKDWPTFASAIGHADGSAMIDIFIGESEFVGKGIGCRVITTFLKHIVFAQEGITKCFIDPEPDNVRAIRCYEKVGFRYLKTLHIPGEPTDAYVMQIEQHDMV